MLEGLPPPSVEHTPSSVPLLRLLDRRNFLRNACTLAVCGILPGCSSSATSPKEKPPPEPSILGKPVSIETENGHEKLWKGDVTFVMKDGQCFLDVNGSCFEGLSMTMDKAEPLSVSDFTVQCLLKTVNAHNRETDIVLTSGIYDIHLSKTDLARTGEKLEQSNTPGIFDITVPYTIVLSGSKTEAKDAKPVGKNYVTVQCRRVTSQ